MKKILLSFRQANQWGVGILISLLVALVVMGSMLLYARGHARQLGEVFLSDIVWEVQAGVCTAQALAERMQDANGFEGDFHQIAEGIRIENPCIDSVQLAPMGHVSYSEPQTSEYIYIRSLFDVPQAERQARVSVHEHTTLLLGPLDYGDRRIILVGQPVYLQSAEGEEYFWGFVLINLNLESILKEEEVDTIDAQGLDYRLMREEDGHRVVLAENMRDSFLWAATCRDEELDEIWSLELRPQWRLIGLPVAATGILVFLVGLFLTWLLQRLKTMGEDMDIVDAANVRLNEISFTDPLTGLLNRRGFDIEASDCINRWPSSVIGMVDVNDFKRFNDVYGHAAGDAVLTDISRDLHRMASLFCGVAGRNGGDEFLICLPGTPAEIESFLRYWGGQTHYFSCQAGGQITYTFSLGYAVYPEHAGALHDLIKCADMAVYEAKQIRDGAHVYRYHSELKSVARINLGFNLKTIMNGLPVGVLVSQAGGSRKVFLVNERLAQLYGCQSVEELLGKKETSFIHPDDREHVNAYAAEMLRRHLANQDQQQKPLYYRIITPQGEIRHLYSIGKFMEDEKLGTLVYVVVYPQDDHK